MNVSGIEWTDRTWNPVSGCSHVSEGCRNCYAEKLFPRPYPGRKFTDIQCHPERLDQPLVIKKPQKIFVNSMSDLFHEDVPDEFIARVFHVAALSPQHTYQILTKRPERMRQWVSDEVARALVIEAEGDADWHAVKWPYDWPLPNVWLGVSVEDQKTADARIPILMQTPAAVRWLSVEPLLGPVDLVNYFWMPDPHGSPADFILSNGIQWVVVGGESGPDARPMHPRWVRNIRDQCRPAGVPFFFKQWGEFVPAEPGKCNHPSSEGAQGPVRSLPNERVDIWKCSMCGRLHDHKIDFERAGKKRAGCTLDGREWKEFPKCN